jgi:hypothetical protein
LVIVLHVFFSWLLCCMSIDLRLVNNTLVSLNLH